MLQFYESFQKYDVPEKIREEVYDNTNKLTLIENFSKVNIFIGANNSGKSKIIRELIRKQPSLQYGDENWNCIVKLLALHYKTVNEKVDSVDVNLSVFSNSEGRTLLNRESIEQIKELAAERKENYDIEQTISILNSLFVAPSFIHSHAVSYHLKDIGEPVIHIDHLRATEILLKLIEIKEETKILIKKLEQLKFSQNSKNIFPRIYIPSLRSLRQFAIESRLVQQTRKEYDFKEDIVIFNGEQLPNEVYNLKNKPYSFRQQILKFETFLSHEFFENKKVELTYDNKEHVLLIKIGDETERPIHDLGDGLQMIIILTYPFFFNECGIVAIEEPELFIHPGLQKLFIKFLITNPVTKNFQILLTTHSNHIVDSINNSNLVSLFGVRKREKVDDISNEKSPDFIIENLAFGNDNLLSLLGITTTSVYLSNCTIWVEGITDKMYIQKYISEYLKNIEPNSKYSICTEFQEGINYSFAFTAGDSIVHWDFSDDGEYNELTNNIIVRKFCSKSLILVDNDFNKNSERKAQLKTLLKNRFVELDLPEIENYLSEEVIKTTILKYKSVKDAVKENTLPDIKAEYFKTKKIGSIIDSTLLKGYAGVKKFSSTDKDGKGSIKSTDKYDFCNKAIESIEFRNMKEESKKLVETILDFVIAHNNK